MNPLTVNEQMKYICMRVYVKSSLSEVTLHFDNVNVTTTDNYWNKPANQVTVASNQWVNIYLTINEYVNDGKISSIKILNRTTDNVSGTEYYFDHITIIDTIGTAINLNGAQVVYPDYGNVWSDGMTVEGSTVVLSGGKPFACARIDFAQPYKVNAETKIIFRMKLSASLNSGFVAIFKRGNEGDDKWLEEYRDYSVGEYATVEYDLSKFTEDGELKGVSFGLFGSSDIAVGTTLYIESISVL